MEDGRSSEQGVAKTKQLKADVGADRYSYVASLPEDVRSQLNQREADSLDIQHALLQASWLSRACLYRAHAFNRRLRVS